MKPRAETPAVKDAERTRFDKWLWASRLYKTRALAAQAIDSGQARLNTLHVKPSHAVRPGDRILVRKHGLVWDIEVKALSDRRGPAPEAARLYEESPESVATRVHELEQRKAAAAIQPRFPGRPTKRQRRRLEDFLNEP